MIDIIALRDQMITVSKTATCSVEFIDDTDKVQLWWIDGLKAYTETLSIHHCSIASSKFVRAKEAAKKVMR